ncbi:hypothetical protein GGX14DRAFT_408033 [Mycena pura]|uniref:Uncharacterized protein n=1 Tax=Mycena pura TaxID=153505 RepID=A0AAD6XWG8_9AGAR|nr:hypothetical protein GGX14DRAFT_408033 [Mycena pura]
MYGRTSVTRYRGTALKGTHWLKIPDYSSEKIGTGPDFMDTGEIRRVTVDPRYSGLDPTRKRIGAGYSPSNRKTGPSTAFVSTVLLSNECRVLFRRPVKRHNKVLELEGILVDSHILTQANTVSREEMQIVFLPLCTVAEASKIGAGTTDFYDRCDNLPAAKQNQIRDSRRNSNHEWGTHSACIWYTRLPAVVRIKIEQERCCASGSLSSQRYPAGLCVSDCDRASGWLENLIRDAGEIRTMDGRRTTVHTALADVERMQKISGSAAVALLKHHVVEMMSDDGETGLGSETETDCECASASASESMVAHLSSDSILVPRRMTGGVRVPWPPHGRHNWHRHLRILSRSLDDGSWILFETCPAVLASDTNNINKCTDGQAADSAKH